MGDHDLRVTGAHGRGGASADAQLGAARLRAVGAAVHLDRRRHRHGRAAGVPQRRGRGGDPRVLPDRRVPPLRGRKRAAHTRVRRAVAAQPRLESVDLRAVRPARRLPHGAASRARRGGAAPPPVAARPRGVAPGTPRGRARSVPCRGARGARRGPQRRLRGRRAPGAERLPQLRQPGEGRDRMGARAGDRGAGRGGGGARHPHRVGKRLAVQRHGRTVDPADAGRRLRWPRP